MYDKGHIQFGSIQEQLAIHAFNRIREIELIKPLFSVVAPDKADKLLRQYRGALYPEYKYEDLKYMQKGKKMFEKLKGLNFHIVSK